MIAIIFFWLLFALVVGMIASSRGRSGFGWCILACLISPLLAGIILLLSANRRGQAGRPNPSTHVKCPDCKELILKDARVCRYCGCKLVMPSLASATDDPSLVSELQEIGAWRVLYVAGIVAIIAAAIWATL